MPRASDFVVLPSPFQPRIFPSSARPLPFRQASWWLGARGVALAVLGAVAHARSFPTDGLQVVPATVRCVYKGGLMGLQLELELGLPARVDGRGCGMDLKFPMILSSGVKNLSSAHRLDKPWALIAMRKLACTA
ncbi:hypothetical protein C8J57DRAFT_1227929 [Mycena rebaudengoi]|nr:hypothetical protein C8J57DRAFT_1227929 [Mycena rebaudengoi]